MCVSVSVHVSTFARVCACEFIHAFATEFVCMCGFACFAPEPPLYILSTGILQWLDHGEAISLFYITTDSNCLFAVAIAYISKCVCK